jgi:carbon storage regulator
MLFLTRKINETIIINDDIELTVIEVRGKSVKLGLNFPPTASVYRREVWERIQAENKGLEADGVSSIEPKLRAKTGSD